MDEKSVRDEAKRLLRALMPEIRSFSRPRSEYVRCIVCDELVLITEADFVYDETGCFYGWECERHI